MAIKKTIDKTVSQDETPTLAAVEKYPTREQLERMKLVQERYIQAMSRQRERGVKS
jgi:hypothetical protein